MAEENRNINSAEDDADDFLGTVPVKEDWGGDGRGRMNLSGRRTAISNEYLPRRYQFFDTDPVSEERIWQINGMPNTVASGSRRLLTWHDCGASTSRVTLPTEFEAPSGIFTADLELFVLKGVIQLGEWQLSKHSYSFIPAGVRVGPWKVVGSQEAEILWMENGFLKYKNLLDNHPDANISDFIPVLDSKLVPWGKTDTVQFVQASKKWLRKDSNGGGVWLLTILPHFDNKYQMIQSYNEEGYCLAGYCDVGNYRILKNHYWYCPTLSTLPRHITDDGGLFFVRVDRDISKIGTVLSYPSGDDQQLDKGC